MSWPIVKLGDICSPKQHPTISSSELLDSGYTVYGANGPIGFYSSYTHENPTIAVTCRGATCGTVNITPPKCYITGNAMALDKLDTGRVDFNYLAHVLRFQGFRSVINGAAQPQITRAPMLGYEIPLPPLEEQKRIAGILDQADSLRRLRVRALEKLNTLGQAVFQEMFGGKSGYPSVQLNAIIAPNDKINYGVVQPGDSVIDGIPLLRAGDVTNNPLDPKTFRRISAEVDIKHKKSRLHGDEILIACVGSIGAIGLAHDGLRGVNIARAVARVRVDPNKASREFIASQLKSASVQNYFQSEIRLVAQPTLNIKQISECVVVLPPLEEQKAFERRISAIYPIMIDAEKSVAQSTALFGSLQSAAFQGRL